jgi:hypothetical protein
MKYAALWTCLGSYKELLLFDYHINTSIRYVPTIFKDKEIVQRAPRYLDIGNEKLVHQLHTHIKQEALSVHLFFLISLK